MSEKLGTLEKKGGGKLKETSLWSNSNPSTASNSFTCTLSASITNFTFIRIYYKPINTSSTIYYIDADIDMLQASTDTGAQNFTLMLCSVGSSDNRKYCRFINCNSNNTIYIGNAYGVNKEIYSNIYNIPTSITGLK